MINEYISSSSFRDFVAFLGHKRTLTINCRQEETWTAICGVTTSRVQTRTTVAGMWSYHKTNNSCRFHSYKHNLAPEHV
jgi:hypothetical protein